MKQQFLFSLRFSLLVCVALFPCLAEIAVGQRHTLVSGLPPKNPELDEGVRAALRGDTETAEKLFRAIREKNPGSRPGGIDASMAFADSSFGQHHFGKLRFWLEKTAEDFPGDPEAFLLLADIAFSDGRLLECSMLTEHALRVVEAGDAAPDRKKSLGLYGEKLRADVAEDRQRWLDAVRFLERLRELEPENTDHLYRLGLALFRSGRQDEAEKMLAEAEANDDRILPALVVLAQLSEYDGRREEAQRLLAEALEKQGENPRVLVAAADLELLWNRLEKVREHAEKARQLDPRSVGAEMTLGIVDLYDGNFEEAEKKFDRIFESMPDHSKTTIGLALALCEQDDGRKIRRAFTIAKRNAEQNPRSVDAQTTLAWVLVKANALEEAEKMLMRQFDAGEMNSPGAYYLAEIYARQNRKDEAVVFLKSALDSNVNFPKRIEAEKLLKTLTEQERIDEQEERK